MVKNENKNVKSFFSEYIMSHAVKWVGQFKIKVQPKLKPKLNILKLKKCIQVSLNLCYEMS